MNRYKQAVTAFLKETGATIYTELVGMDYNELWGDNQIRPKYRVTIKTSQGTVNNPRPR